MSNQSYIVKPCQSLKGEVFVPGDKSISHRALMLTALANGVSTIHGLLMGEDCLATLNIMRALGVDIVALSDNSFQVTGVGLHGLKAPKTALDCGNSGTAMRLLSGLLAGQTFNSELIGDESLMQRPMGRVVNPLTQMGAVIEMSCAGTAPLQIQGACQLQGFEYHSPVASAQVKSCLLLASLYANGETKIIEPGVTRDHTELMLQALGYSIIQQDKIVTIKSGGSLQAIDINIPGDISSAAFFIVAACITPNSHIRLKNVGINPTRTGIIDILCLMGADIKIENQSMQGQEPVADIIVQSSDLVGIEIPEKTIPKAIDEFPVVFIAAACAKGKTILRGASELRVKESDRIAAMAKGLTQLGIENEVLEDGLIIQGGELQGGEVNSFGDHRIAMAFAIAACAAKKAVKIADCDNVATSFPHFVSLAKQVGINIKSR